MSDKQLHRDWDPPATARSRSLLDRMVEAGRSENRAASERLTAVGELFEERLRQRGEEADWAVDTWAAVGAEVAAALRVSLGKAGSLMQYGLALRRRPAVAALFAAGDIDLATVRVIVYRTDAITDEAILADVDESIANVLTALPSWTEGRLAREVDAIVNAVDPDAVRRVRERARDRDVTIWDDGAGLSDLSGRLLTTDAQLLDKRLDALAATVCAADPRNAGQRRADALGALAAGADRLMCQCEQADCPAVAATGAPVVIHVVADQATLEGRSDKPAYLHGQGGLIYADLLRDLAKRATLRPLVPPGPEAEPRYRPSRALADFVRARDLTCRAPGCDRPAVACDLDHTIPYADGGATHASNIKCLCRFHHLIKTFWGWKDRQLEDGTVIWSLPDGKTYVTLPGSAVLFPFLMTPTGPAPTSPPRTDEAGGDRTAMMPLRTRTRAQNRAQRIATERSHTRRSRENSGAPAATGPPRHPDEGPPF